MKPIIITFALLLTLVGCNRSDDSSGDALGAGYDLNFTTPLTAMQKQEGLFSDVTDDEMYNLLLCNETSTSDKLFTDRYSTRWQTMSRTKKGPDAPILLSQNEIQYSTKTGGAVYTLTETAQRWELGGASALFGGVYQTEKLCTADAPCGDEQMVYKVQNALYVARVKAQMERIQDQQKYSLQMECRFNNDPSTPEELTVEFASFEVGGQSIAAMVQTKKNFGEVVCEGENIGAGTETSVEIVARDRLPHLDSVKTFYKTGEAPCVRSLLFRGETITVDQMVIEGWAQESTSYSLDGDFKDI